MAILPWLVPLFVALIADHLHPADHALAAAAQMGLITMTDTALAATLFGPEDLRVVERDARAARARHGARPRSAPAASAAPTCTISATRAPATSSSPRRWSSATRSPARSSRSTAPAPGLSVGDHVAVNPSRWCGHCAPLPRGPAEPLREHLLHGLGLEDAAYAGRLRQPVRRDAGAMRQSAAHVPCQARPRSPSRSPSACMRWRAPARSGRQARRRCSAPGRSAC